MNRWIGATVAGLCCLAAPVMAFADVVYATGFEPPAFTTGALAGQNGWSGSIGQVESTMVFAGSQAVGFDATGASGQQINGVLVPAAGQGGIEQVTDEFYFSANDANVVWDSFAFFGNAGFIGQLAITNGTACLGLASTCVGSVSVAAGAWHSYTMAFDFATGTQAAYVDGTFIGSGPLASASTLLTVADFGIDGSNGSATSQAYVDDFAINAPEPSSLALLGCGLAALGMLASLRRAVPAAPPPSRAGRAV